MKPWMWHSLCGPVDPDFVADATFEERFVQNEDGEYEREEEEDDEYFSD